MPERKEPGPDHPITISPNPAEVTVSVPPQPGEVSGKTLARTTRALSLKESTYPAVQYVPLTDVDTTLLERTDHHTYCPYKGDCSYYSIPSLGERGVNAVWTYEQPYPAVASIAGHVAFYPDRVDIR